MDPDFLSYVGLGGTTFSKPKEGAQTFSILDSLRKRSALQELDLEPKRMAVVDMEGGNFEYGRELEWEADGNEVIETQSNVISQLMLIEKEMVETTGNDRRGEGRSRSWKKEARCRSQRQSNNQLRYQEDGGGLGKSSSRRVLDFQ